MALDDQDGAEGPKTRGHCALGAQEGTEQSAACHRAGRVLAQPGAEVVREVSGSLEGTGQPGKLRVGRRVQINEEGVWLRQDGAERLGGRQVPGHGDNKDG